MLVDRDKAINQASRVKGTDISKDVKSIEIALGFKLLPWQIYYLYTGEVRQTGKTTAYIIRMLTKESTPLDFRKHNTVKRFMDLTCSGYASYFKRETINIYKLLKKQGIETRELLY